MHREREQRQTDRGKERGGIKLARERTRKTYWGEIERLNSGEKRKNEREWEGDAKRNIENSSTERTGKYKK